MLVPIPSLQHLDLALGIFLVSVRSAKCFRQHTFCAAAGLSAVFLWAFVLFSAKPGAALLVLYCYLFALQYVACVPNEAEFWFLASTAATGHTLSSLWFWKRHVFHSRSLSTRSNPYFR